MKYAALLAFLVVAAFGYVLRLLNLRYLREHGHEVPPEFEGQADPSLLAKTSDYTVDRTRAGMFESLFDDVVLLVFLFGGVAAGYDGWIAARSSSFFLSGILFFLGLVWAKTFLGIPFDLYSTFRIENRYGFNTTTGKLWLADFVKSLAVSSVLLAILAAAALGLIAWSPERWWLWVWAFFVGFSVLLLFLSPYVIEPLFFKFEPVREEGLEEEIRGIAEKAGLKVSRIFQVDASRRSKHSNAYFSGIGKVKRIVLFDTLLAQMTHAEILAVLAHEMGHWKKRHVLKRLGLTAGTALIALWLAFRLLRWGGLPGVIGLDSASPYLQWVILGFLGTIASFPVGPLFAALSRRDEREADRYAAELTGSPEALASALLKLSRETLANLHPHPLYAEVYYSHPPVTERVRELRARAR
ncbi:MAG: M48 family metallopeptidase [Deltaproteobacteria bacterium]|nr:M48 family metallopeptidase [Deltaproteobacteria bacterium]